MIRRIVPNVRALVFDLAGVLVDIRGPESLERLSEGRVTRDDFFRFWSQSPWAHRIHLGECSPEQFASGAVREFSLSTSPENFLVEFRAWLQGPYPGALALLDALRPHYQLACLSNAHELDVARFRHEFDLDRHVDRCFFSNEIRLRKPDLACYEYAIRELGVRPHEVAFFDDSKENVDAATILGIHGYVVDGFESLKGELARLGLLR
jgi:putative hydrolase of the HAD superfamily